ncbi:MAG: hypothetical protein HQK77_18605, partial [Desulfobacterales bacterium]|nr:hypothetical protein [Desulfobacterales bacterium]
EPLNPNEPICTDSSVIVGQDTLLVRNCTEYRIDGTALQVLSNAIQATSGDVGDATMSIALTRMVAGNDVHDIQQPASVAIEPNLPVNKDNAGEPVIILYDGDNPPAGLENDIWESSAGAGVTNAGHGFIETYIQSSFTAVPDAASGQHSADTQRVQTYIDMDGIRGDSIMGVPVSTSKIADEAISYSICMATTGTVFDSTNVDQALNTELAGPADVIANEMNTTREIALGSILSQSDASTLLGWVLHDVICQGMAHLTALTGSMDAAFIPTRFDLWAPNITTSDINFGVNATTIDWAGILGRMTQAGLNGEPIVLTP